MKDQSSSACTSVTSMPCILSSRSLSQRAPASTRSFKIVLWCTSVMRSILLMLFPSTSSRRIVSAWSIGRYMPSKGSSRGSVNRLWHCWQAYRCSPLRFFPLRLHSIRQLWHVIVKSPVEFHSQKPDTGVVGSCGFGCANHGPGDDWRRCWGFSIHDSIIAYPPYGCQAETQERLNIFCLHPYWGYGIMGAWQNRSECPRKRWHTSSAWAERVAHWADRKSTRLNSS